MKVDDSYDLNHTLFLKESLSDINAANALLHSEQFSQAVYFFQQSVEKSCKYLGLTLKAINYKDIKKYGHDPHKVLNKIFIDIEKISGQKSNFNEIEKNYLSKSLEGRVNYICNDLKEALDKELIPISNGESPIDLLIKYFNENPLNKLYPSDIVTLLNQTSHIPEVLSLCKKMIKELNDIDICTTCQTYLSFLVWGIEANSRYPDYKNKTTPSILYSETSPIIVHLPFLIKIQANCISNLFLYFNSPAG